MFGFKEAGIVGINKRNLDFVLAHNRRKFYPNADSKLKTKEIALSLGLNVPDLFANIRYQYEVKQFEDIVQPYDKFVVKPDRGSGGDGILVIIEKVMAGYKKASGNIMSRQETRYHLQNMLSGMYSLGGHDDTIVIERMVEFDPIFDEIAYQGVPDIRLIVLEGKVLMGMLRLPSKASDGKANLHTGGVGVGIDMDTGITTTAIQRNRYIDVHPETNKPLTGRQIPYWKDMLDMATKMQKASGLGYIGVDIVLDKNKGPMILEINARPGISIQIANQCGLLSRV
ncbi:MAG: alpha-L-glutamate ligase-like protein [Micavibrio sp.]|nr:alpha-L-glutamate ligase-like protein [Micavibrio sp.]|tara:strand:+ start:104 stop:955 length:852 start_codon:yes stop_codon:yes gene_type:complete